MILSFTLGNFRSFREPQTFSMVASGRQPDHPEHLKDIPQSEEKALPLAVLYGANGAGKSNLITALEALRYLVNFAPVGGDKRPVRLRTAFAFDPALAREPTSFELQFVGTGRVYTYGLKVEDQVVREEWLDYVTGEKPHTLFERLTPPGGGGVKIEVGDALREDEKGASDKVVAMSKIGCKPEQTFLHSLGATLAATDLGSWIAPVLKWFKESLVIIRADQKFQNLAEYLIEEPSFAAFAGRMLREAGTGVQSLAVKSSPLDPAFAADLVPMLKRLEERREGVHILSKEQGIDLILDKQAGAAPMLRRLESVHLTKGGGSVELPFGEESDGTRRLTHLLPALHEASLEGTVFVVDELDRSLHPELSRFFLRVFLAATQGQGSQMILTTHECNLMDLDLLRRDELWFAEKDLEGASTLYSLTDFKVRTDLRVDKGYLQGRFGAIPFLGNVDRLVESLKKSDHGAATETTTPDHQTV